MNNYEEHRRFFLFFFFFFVTLTLTNIFKLAFVKILVFYSYYYLRHPPVTFFDI